MLEIIGLLFVLFSLRSVVRLLELRLLGVDLAHCLGVLERLALGLSRSDLLIRKLLHFLRDVLRGPRSGGVLAAADLSEDRLVELRHFLDDLAELIALALGEGLNELLEGFPLVREEAARRVD